nr:tyrosine-protein kinase JAK2-like isoform X2 [Pocillopora verrucosa]
MILDITDALLFLEEKGLVHRAVMAANVLVGDGYICKLSGMQHLRKLTRQTEDPDSLYSYCSSDDDLPDFVNSGNEEKLPLRWKAPEVLLECRFSTASDVWALGVLMYEVLTYGCLPYRLISDNEELYSRVKNGREILPFESCFEEDEYCLMQQCFQFQRRRRPKLHNVRSRLCEMIENADKEQVRCDPPPLRACGIFPTRNIEDACCSYSDSVCKECTSQSADEGPTLSNGSYYVHNLMSHKERVKEQISNRNPSLDLDDLPRKIPLGRTSDSYVSEKIRTMDDHHLRGLLALKHPNLVTLKIDNLDSHCLIANIITEEAPLGNLKNYVLERRCQLGDIVTFLSQVASALHYLHENHIVHGDLRATYVNVVSPAKIKVARLGRSKPLVMSEYEVTSTSCVVKVAMHPDATRWSAPEVILDGHYTHASDVWSFGILAWELYTSFADGLDGRDSSLPFFDLGNEEILRHLRDNGPLEKPEGCPEWVYIIMHQCWAYVPQQRPPFLAIFDCLTSREPMNSWIMKIWLKTHDKSEWPDLSTPQPRGACHVTCSEKHSSNDIIEKMCSPDFFSENEYTYVCRRSGIAGGKDVYSKTDGTLDVTDDIYQYPTVYSSYIKLEENPELVPQKAPINNDASYLYPVSTTVGDLSSFEGNEENDNGVTESTRGHGGGRVVPTTRTFNPQVKKLKKRSGAHGSSAVDLNNGKASLLEDTPDLLYVNLGTQPDQEYTPLYENIKVIPRETSSKREEYVEGGTLSF